MLFSSEKYCFEKLSGLTFANRLFKDVGGGAALFDKAVYVNAGLFKLCISVGDGSLA